MTTEIKLDEVHDRIIELFNIPPEEAKDRVFVHQITFIDEGEESLRWEITVIEKDEERD